MREEAQGNQKVRGRRPTFLYVNAAKSLAIAIDVRASRTFLMVTDSIGKQVGDITSFPTLVDPKCSIERLIVEIKKTLAGADAVCDGIGIVVPGMLDLRSGVVWNAPTLGWSNVQLHAQLEEAFPGIEIHLENSGKACALSQLWSPSGKGAALNDLVFVSVSDGVGVGVVINGEVIRGKHNTAGEFGHVPLSIDGPTCRAGQTAAGRIYLKPGDAVPLFRTPFLARGHRSPARPPTLRSRTSSHGHAATTVGRLTALDSTARYLGLGLASIINAIDPTKIFIGGEITEAWDIIEPHVQSCYP